MVLATFEVRVSHHRSAYPAGGRVASRQCASREPRIAGGRGGLPWPRTVLTPLLFPLFTFL